jgi:hypothetical protein
MYRCAPVIYKRDIGREIEVLSLPRQEVQNPIQKITEAKRGMG